MATPRFVAILLVCVSMAQGARLRHQVRNVSANGLIKHNASTMAHQQPQEEMPEECVQQMNELQMDSAKKEAAAQCEQDGKYPEKVITALQNADEAEASSHAKKLFTECAGLSEKCAGLAAPNLVIQLRLSGAAVSNECVMKMQSAQTNETHMTQAQQCDEQKQLSQKTLVALNEQDIKGAMDTTERSLKECMGLSNKCSYQVAPIIVSSIIQRAMQQQEQQMQETVVLVAQPVIIVEEPMLVVEEPSAVAPTTTKAKQVSVAQKKHKAKSLLEFAMTHKSWH